MRALFSLLRCVYEKEDADGNHGVALGRDIVKVAGYAMEKNFTVLGPSVLPLSEQLKVRGARVSRARARARARDLARSLGDGGGSFSESRDPETRPLPSARSLAREKVVWAIVKRKCVKGLRGAFGDKSAIGKALPERTKPYVPDFKRGIDHFCIHAGGRAVIDGIVKNLNLQEHHEAPSRHALYNYGNTSSSSIWYEMDYVRKHGNLRRGHRVLQVAFGSGFKCNSAVWLALQHGESGNAPPPAVPAH